MSDRAEDSGSRTAVRTIRIPEPTDRALEKIADDDGRSVNAEINSIIREHLEHNIKMQEFGFAVFPRQFFKAIIEELDEDTLARIGRGVVPAMWKDMASFWDQDSSPEGILRYLKKRMRLTHNVQTTITQEMGEYAIVYRHDFGPKWSILMKSAFQEFVSKSFHVEPKISAGESVVSVRFKTNPRSSSD